MIETQLQELRERVRKKSATAVVTEQAMPNGGLLIRVSGVALTGWNRPAADVLFVAPPGYPGSAPDCFWVEPSGLRLEGERTPQASNDSNPIPGDPQPGRSTTWFSWHVQGWNPNVNTLASFYQLILDRLRPAR